MPGLAESVLVGNEVAYIDFFLRIGTADGTGIDQAVRDAFVAAYSEPDALRCAFEYYRAMPTTAEQIADCVSRRRLTMPTLAVGGQVVGELTARQLAPVADDLTSELIGESGHIVPLDRPADLLRILHSFMKRTTGADRG